MPTNRFKKFVFEKHYQKKKFKITVVYWFKDAIKMDTFYFNEYEEAFKMSKKYNGHVKIYDHKNDIIYSCFNGKKKHKGGNHYV